MNIDYDIIKTEVNDEIKLELVFQLLKQIKNNLYIHQTIYGHFSNKTISNYIKLFKEYFTNHCTCKELKEYLDYINIIGINKFIQILDNNFFEYTD